MLPKGANPGGSRQRPPPPREVTVPTIYVQFRVLTVWKGVEEPLLWVRTNLDSRACGYDFTIGRSYLVYATESSGSLWTGVCGRTEAESHAKEDIDALGPPHRTYPDPGQPWR